MNITHTHCLIARCPVCHHPKAIAEDDTPLEEFRFLHLTPERVPVEVAKGMIVEWGCECKGKA